MYTLITNKIIIIVSHFGASTLQIITIWTKIRNTMLFTQISHGMNTKVLYTKYTNNYYLD